MRLYMDSDTGGRGKVSPLDENGDRDSQISFQHVHASPLRSDVCYNYLMDWQSHIERIPDVMLGKPVFRGTRITVEFVLERLAQGARPEDLVASHPPLSAEDVRAALAYAVSVVRQDELLLSAR